MPLTFRDTKGSPLTSAEADANIRQLATPRQYIEVAAPLGGTSALPQSQFTPIPLTETISSSGPGLVVNGQIVIPASGRWTVGCYAQVLASAQTYSQVGVDRQINGAGAFVTLCTASMTGANSGYGASGISKPVDLLAGDILRMSVYTEGSSAVLIKNQATARPTLFAQQLPS